jgi:hypothetical protein
MPNDLYSLIYQGDFNDPTTDDSGYGSLPAAEKNQIYFAYFSSVGGTGPELIDQTAYFLKYLIDAQGNVVTPQPNSIDILNMLQNFEPGKPVNVTSLEGTTLFSPLLGTKQITDVGKIQTLLVTETSSIRTEFLPTMSFAPEGAFLQQLNNPPDFYFLARKEGNTTFTSEATRTLAFQGVIADVQDNFDPSSNVWEYTFNHDLGNYGITAKFKAGASVEFQNFQVLEYDYYTGEYTYGFSDTIKLEIVKSSDNWLTSQSLDIIKLPNTPIANPEPTITSIINNKLYTANLENNWNPGRYITIETLPYVFLSGDKVRVQWYLEKAPTTLGPSVIVYGTPSSYGTFFTLTTNYSNNLQITSSYWDGATYPQPGTNTTQWLTASLGLSGFINNNMIQLTPTASITQGFDAIYLPANLKPGDYIRFEYDPTKQSRIYNIGVLDDGRTTVEINPPIPTGTILNHFCVYRINPNAGNQIILNVKKPPGTTGQPLTGFIKPQYMTKELEDNFTTIIQKLAAEGTI